MVGAWVRRPESAAISGIIFAVILGTVILLLRSAAPESLADADGWIEAGAGRESVDRALGLIPFAGIAFLWFIAVIRSRVGADEDRFIGTVFLGSGLIFVAMLFTAAAVLRATLSLVDAGVDISAETLAWSWSLGAVLLGQFGGRMAAVFALTVATASRRAGVLPRWVVMIGYVVGISLLLTPPLPPPVQLFFPAWVLLLGILMLTRRRQAAAR
jgi:hypothetical protein